MKQIIKKFSILATMSLIAFAVAFGIAAPKHAYADAKADACQGVALVSGSTTAGCGTADANAKGVNGLITTVVNILSIVVGLIAVIMIIIGGMRFILSGGDANTTNSARNTIIYAIVGLVIVAVAQVLVKFVLNKIPT